jgi:hypothetical protein
MVPFGGERFVSSKGVLEFLPDGPFGDFRLFMALNTNNDNNSPTNPAIRRGN